MDVIGTGAGDDVVMKGATGFNSAGDIVTGTGNDRVIVTGGANGFWDGGDGIDLLDINQTTLG